MGTSHKFREAAAKIALAVSLAGATGRLEEIASQYPEFGAMCRSSGLVAGNVGLEEPAAKMPRLDDLQSLLTMGMGCGMAGVGGCGVTPQVNVNDPEIQKKLDTWVEAKRAKNYTVSDALRNELHFMGIDADAERPPTFKR